MLLFEIFEFLAGLDLLHAFHCAQLQPHQPPLVLSKKSMLNPKSYDGLLGHPGQLIRLSIVIFVFAADRNCRLLSKDAAEMLTDGDSWSGMRLDLPFDLAVTSGFNLVEDSLCCPTSDGCAYWICGSM